MGPAFHVKVFGPGSIKGLSYRVSGPRSRVPRKGPGFRVPGEGSQVEGPGSGSHVRVPGPVSRVSGLTFPVCRLK